MAKAPRILGTDTLRLAYPKLNMAIDNSNEALTKASTAETNAVDAKNMSESTQTQLNNIIIDSGTSDAEVIQARGGEPVLNDRLNKYDEKTPINALDFGVIGDRDVDESPFIQNAIDAAIAAGLKELVFPKKTYRIERPIYIRDSLIIDFQGSTF